MPARRLIASLLIYSVQETDSRSVTGLTGIVSPTCARVSALDIGAATGAFGVGFLLRLESARDATLFQALCHCL